MQIKIPNNWTPRPYQENLYDALVEDGLTRAAAVWHRRAGKDLTAINITNVLAHTRVGTYYHLLPTYNQARKVIWDGMDNDGRPFLDYFHRDLITAKSSQEMQIKFLNGSIYQLVGADTYDRLVGPNPIGMILSEWAVSPNYPKAWDYLRPILAGNNGWAVFLFTPRGRNHGYDLFQTAKDSPRWFCERLTVDDTHAIPPEIIDQERVDGMSEELIQQEFFCSWVAPQWGAYYGQLMTLARESGRIGKVPHQPGHEVHTFWDLGVGDPTAIWFGQFIHREIHLIDYYEMDGCGLDHYAAVLRDRQESEGYLYGSHWGPHDIEARELGTGQSRRSIAKGLGIDFRVASRIPNKMDGIHLARTLIPICWFDEDKCARGIDCLENYRKEWIDKLNTWRPTPLHDEYSHGADAFVVMAQGYTAARGFKPKDTPLDRYERGLRRKREPYSPWAA